MNRFKLATIIGAMGLAVSFTLGGGVPQAAAKSASYCERYARDFANSHNNAGADILSGAVSGAIGGAILGGIIGGRHKIDNGAAIGAGVGTATGALSSSSGWRHDYNVAFERCRNSDNYSGTAYLRAVPPEGSAAWMNYCTSRYRSFNPDTGMYLTYAGEWRPCH
jgi:hypothetical protein